MVGFFRSSLACVFFWVTLERLVMSSAEKGTDPQSITEGEGPFQLQHEGLLLPSLVNTPDFLRLCRIADINLQTPSPYHKLLVVGLNSLPACAALPSSMSFDLARPCCVSEYDYCQRVADLGVMPEHDAPVCGIPDSGSWLGR